MSVEVDIEGFDPDNLTHEQRLAVADCAIEVARQLFALPRNERGNLNTNDEVNVKVGLLAVLFSDSTHWRQHLKRLGELN